MAIFSVKKVEKHWLKLLTRHLLNSQHFHVPLFAPINEFDAQAENSAISTLM